MKRFLSILLASLMILGCMAVTVSADAPTLTLYGSNQLTAITTDKTVAAGKYVMVNAVADATYYRNGVAVETKEGLYANTVALPVVAGTNAFQAEVGGVKSEPIYIYGIGVTNKAGETLQSSNPHTGSGIKYSTAHSSPRYAVATEEMLTTAHGAETAAAIMDGRSTITYSINSSDAQSGGELNNNAFSAEGYEAIEYRTDAFHVGNSTTSLQQILRLYNGSYTNAIYIPAGNTVYVNAGSTGATITTNRWNSYAVVLYKDKATYDAYLNEVLLAKNATAKSSLANGSATATSKYTSGATATSPKHPYYSNTSYSKHVLVAEPTFTATADTTANTITVSAANLADGVSVNVYKDGSKVGTVALTEGAGTYTVTESGSYVVKAEDANGTVQINMSGALLQSEAAAFTVSGGSDPVVPVLVSGSIAEGITINRAALADSTDVIAVVAVTAAGVPTVQLSTESTVENTFAVTGAAKVFVWDWDTLAPLCAPIQ